MRNQVLIINLKLTSKSIITEIYLSNRRSQTLLKLGIINIVKQRRNNDRWKHDRTTTWQHVDYALLQDSICDCDGVRTPDGRASNKPLFSEHARKLSYASPIIASHPDPGLGAGQLLNGKPPETCTSFRCLCPSWQQQKLSVTLPS